MASPIYLLAGTTTTLINGNGVSNVNGNGQNVGAIANDTNLDEFVFIKLVVSFSVTPTLNMPIDFFLLPILGGGAMTNPFMPAAFVGSFLVFNQTATQNIFLGPFPLGPFTYNGALLNRSGQTMSANWGAYAYGYRRQVG